MKTDDRELEDLQNLVKHPGFQRFVSAVNAEWQEQINSKLASALSDTDDALAASKMRQVVVAKAAIERMLKWPQERIAMLERQTHSQQLAQNMTRGGY